MKIFTITMSLLLFLSPSISLAVEHVYGYYKNNGTYIKPYYKSSPNNTSKDNWDVKGNVNPYTGQKGYNNPDKKDNYNNFYNYQKMSNRIKI